MKIDLQSIDTTSFFVDPKPFNNEILFLIQPQHIGCKWSQANKHFRSSVWNSEGQLVSASFPKFTNWGENPENFPVPTSLTGCQVLEKLDGSTLILSKYKSNFIIRTRGTIDATTQANGDEIQLFKDSILSKLQSAYLDDNWDQSFIFEWTTPTNRIVIRYGDTPEFRLIGMINHEDYSLVHQNELDGFAQFHGLVRPKSYDFHDIPSLLTLVEAWKGVEGVCIYSNYGQTIHKVKGDDYLVRHRLKEEFSSYEKVLDFYISLGCPSYNDFFAKVTEVVDWETANGCIGDISRCVEGYKEVQKIIEHMKSFVEPLKKVSRKDAALKIISSYGGESNNRAGFCFQLLDGKELGQDSIKKLLWQVTKD